MTMETMEGKAERNINIATDALIDTIDVLADTYSLTNGALCAIIRNLGVEPTLVKSMFINAKDIRTIDSLTPGSRAARLYEWLEEK